MPESESVLLLKTSRKYQAEISSVFQKQCHVTGIAFVKGSPDFAQG
jgi:hypothetical protein